MASISAYAGVNAIVSARAGSAPIRPISQMSRPAATASCEGSAKGTYRTGTPSRSAIARPRSGATPMGSPASFRPLTSRKLERLIPTRRVPLGASSASTVRNSGAPGGGGRSSPGLSCFNGMSLIDLPSGSLPSGRSTRDQSHGSPSAAIRDGGLDPRPTPPLNPTAP